MSVAAVRSHGKLLSIIFDVERSSLLRGRISATYGNFLLPLREKLRLLSCVSLNEILVEGLRNVWLKHFKASIKSSGGADCFSLNGPLLTL